MKGFIIATNDVFELEDQDKHYVTIFMECLRVNDEQEAVVGSSLAPNPLLPISLSGKKKKRKTDQALTSICCVGARKREVCGMEVGVEKHSCRVGLWRKT